jgi:hypothetical protein
MAMMRLEELGELEKFNDLIRTQNCSLPACSIVPQPCGTQGINQWHYMEEYHGIVQSRY